MTEAATEKTEFELAAEWQAEAKGQTLATLPAFLEKLAAYPHDYGTIVRAMGAAAVAACWAMDKTPNAGITGFQASCVNWEFLSNWGGITAPAWILKAEDLLFPQYEEKFTSISRDTATWVRDQAHLKLTELSGDREFPPHPSIIAHLRELASGKPPFGLTVRD